MCRMKFEVCVGIGVFSAFNYLFLSESRLNWYKNNSISTIMFITKKLVSQIIEILINSQIAVPKKQQRNKIRIVSLKNRIVTSQLE